VAISYSKVNRKSLIGSYELDQIKIQAIDLRFNLYQFIEIYCKTTHQFQKYSYFVHKDKIYPKIDNRID
jgi:hypothetical protein